MTNTPKRTRFEQMMSCLEVIRAGTDHPTRLMYRANLSWSVCAELLDYLGTHGLVTYEWVRRYGDQTRTNIHITTRGLELLKEYERIKRELLGVDSLVLPRSDFAGGH